MTRMHRKLIGTWKSNRKMTLRAYPGYESMDPARQKKLAKLFGRMELRYTPKYVHTTLGDWLERERYEVLGEDMNSIAIKIGPKKQRSAIHKANADFAKELLGNDSPFESRIYHVHFQEKRNRDYYWISSNFPLINTVFVEWFHRVQGRTD